MLASHSESESLWLRYPYLAELRLNEYAGLWIQSRLVQTTSVELSPTEIPAFSRDW